MAVPLSDAFLYCCYCGGDLKFIQDFAYSCTRCEKRSYLSPALGCNCILIQNDTVLMTQRARDPEAGTWSLPGGFAHPFENCSETMIREVHEELNVSISVECLIGSDYCNYIYQNISRPVIVVYGVGQIISGEIKCQDDVSDYAWLSMDKIKTMPLFHPFEVEMMNQAFAYRNRI